MHTITWFEIPTLQLGRATEFYTALTGYDLKPTDFQGYAMVVFPGEQSDVRGALIRDEKCPPGKGTVIYLDASPYPGGLDGALSRVEKAGGKVLVPRMSIGDMGWIGVIEDSEGNSIGLHVRA